MTPHTHTRPEAVEVRYWQTPVRPLDLVSGETYVDTANGELLTVGAVNLDAALDDPNASVRVLTRDGAWVSFGALYGGLRLCLDSACRMLGVVDPTLAGFDRRAGFPWSPIGGLHGFPNRLDVCLTVDADAVRYSPDDEGVDADALVIVRAEVHSPDDLVVALPVLGGPAREHISAAIRQAVADERVGEFDIRLVEGRSRWVAFDVTYLVDGDDR